MTRHATGHVQLVHRAKGNQFYAKWRTPDGRQLQRKLGPAWAERGRPPAGYYTRRTAEAELRRILTDLERGTRANAGKTGATFTDAALEWLRYVEHDRKRRASTVADYRGVINHALIPELGDTPLEDITADRIDGYRARLVDEGKLSARTINKHLVMLHGIFRRAQRAYRLPVNPAVGVERQPIRRTGDFRVLDPPEVEQLARHADTRQDAALYVVAAFTGLRMGELRALRWRDVDFGKRLVHVKRNVTRNLEDDPKSGKVRSVPLIDRAARSLDELSRREHFTEPDAYVFPSQVGGPFDDNRLRRRYRAALDRAGLERLRFHDLRHSFGTLAVQAFPLSDVKAYMGHADIATTMIYVHHVPQHDAADRLGAVLNQTQHPLGEDVSPDVSRTERFSAQLSDTDTA